MFFINHSFFLFIMMEKGVYLSCQDERKYPQKKRRTLGSALRKGPNRKGDNYLWIFVRKELSGGEGKKASGTAEADANAKKQELFCISDTGVKQSVVGVCAL